MTTVPIPPPSFFHGLFLGSVTYSFFRFLSPIVTTSFGTPSFQSNVSKLNSGKSYHYHSLLPSTIHALLQIVGTWGVVFHGRRGLDYDHDIADLKITSSPAILFDEQTIVTYGLTYFGPTVYMGVFVGYLLTDTILAPSFKDMEYVYVVHHLAASLCWTYCASFRIMQNYASLLQFCELSTPLMNIRQILLISGYKSSDLSVTLISLSFFLVFAMVRVAPIPFLLRDWVFRDFSSVRDVVGIGGSAFLTMFVVVHVALQLGWFGIMCGKLWEIAFGKRKQEKNGKKKS
eukprot:CAMPEP_0171328576 /NCGR_PEP_ID=MMETSP0878-20121228/736_1 /TAXON_ID=67004 /ORGANISM="Thalassiosira weissflogii, Strain CCMP1336" /LENGTH=287 /DNA_ID=CAMNT_0011828435 /DNA_START=47 /DNA_END=910 /DNA_ORIENTATION=+